MLAAMALAAAACVGARRSRRRWSLPALVGVAGQVLPRGPAGQRARSTLRPGRRSPGRMSPLLIAVALVAAIGRGRWRWPALVAGPAGARRAARAVGLRRRPLTAADGVHRDLVRRAAAAGLRRRAAPRRPTSTSPTTRSPPTWWRGGATGAGSPTGSSTGSTTRCSPRSPAGPGRAPAGHRQRAPLPGLRLLRADRAADRAGGDPVTGRGRCRAVRSLVVVVGAPLLVGLMRAGPGPAGGPGRRRDRPAVAGPAQAAPQGADQPRTAPAGRSGPRRCCWSAPRWWWRRSCRWSRTASPLDRRWPTCSSWSRCSRSARSRWPWPGWTPAPRSAAWAPAGR